MNYQYRYGGSTRDVLEKLYSEGGVGRFYRGVGFALLQQPLSRFGDTAANAGMGVLLDSFEVTSTLPVFVKTVSASAAAAVWRIGLMPVDSFKTTLQVVSEGKPCIQGAVCGMARGRKKPASAASADLRRHDLARSTGRRQRRGSNTPAKNRAEGHRRAVRRQRSNAGELIRGTLPLVRHLQLAAGTCVCARACGRRVIT